jgi:transcription antitermination factor NusG
MMEKRLASQPARWYAVYTKARFEKKVYNDLLLKGIECYLPLKKEKRQWSDRIKEVEEPLIRGYIFVRIKLKFYYDVLVVPGAISFVRFDNQPAVIPDSQMEDLKLFMLHEAAQVNVTSERISKGDIVRVIDGPLKNVTGEVAQIRGRRRLLLRFRALGYCVYAEIGLNKIETVKEECRKVG